MRDGYAPIDDVSVFVGEDGLNACSARLSGMDVAEEVASIGTVWLSALPSLARNGHAAAPLPVAAVTLYFPDGSAHGLKDGPRLSGQGRVLP